jgi:hypothetical protein
MARRTATLVLLAAAAGAQPPASEGFKRTDALRAELATRLAEAKKQEEFEAKPREEKLAILLLLADPRLKPPPKFDRVEIVPDKVAKEILEWDQVQTDKPSESAVRALTHLRDALHKRYGDPAVVDYSRTDRYDVSKLLVKELTSKHLHLRAASFEMLKDIYRNPNGLFYRPDATERMRKDKQREWERYITKERR